jgi:hypothetical protein
LQAIATAVDPRLAVRLDGSATEWSAYFDIVDKPLGELPEVQVAKVSLGATFQFQPRRSLPLQAV